MGWACGGCGGENECIHTGFWWGRVKGRVHMQDLGINGRIALTWIIRKVDERLWTGFISLVIVKVVGCCERGNEHSGSIGCEELIDLLRNCKLVASTEGLSSMQISLGAFGFRWVVQGIKNKDDVSTDTHRMCDCVQIG